MNNPEIQATAFAERYNDKPNPNLKPLWIHVEIYEQVYDAAGEYLKLHPIVVCCYDFKNDNARKDFGALCAALYRNSRSIYRITTTNMR